MALGMGTICVLLVYINGTGERGSLERGRKRKRRGKASEVERPAQGNRMKVKAENIELKRVGRGKGIDSTTYKGRGERRKEKKHFKRRGIRLGNESWGIGEPRANPKNRGRTLPWKGKIKRRPSNGELRSQKERATKLKPYVGEGRKTQMGKLRNSRGTWKTEKKNS